MKLTRPQKAILGLFFIALVAFSFFFLRGDKTPSSPSEDDPTAEAADPVDDQGPKSDISASLMKNYGLESTSPLDDVLLTEEMLQSFFLLIKVEDPLPMGENSEVTTALTGQNPYRIRFLSPDSEWINDQGELVDRWGTPLSFHPADLARVGIRSAGPDKILWTADDITNGEDAEPFSMDRRLPVQGVTPNE